MRARLESTLQENPYSSVVDLEINGAFEINQYAVTEKNTLSYLELDSRIELTDRELRRLIKGIDIFREKTKTFKHYARLIFVRDFSIKIQMTEGRGDCSSSYEDYREENDDFFEDQHHSFTF